MMVSQASPLAPCPFLRSCSVRLFYSPLTLSPRKISMNCYTLSSVESIGRPASGTISSLVFKIPFPDEGPKHLLAQYQALRVERGQEDETHYSAAAGRLALGAYNDDSVRAEREDWCERAISAFDEIVDMNKDSIRHVELILPTGGMATPLNLCPSLTKIANLESLCVQWPLRGYMPMTLILMSDWAHILSDNIFPALFGFREELMALLATHATSLKRLRIALPQSTPRPPFSALSLDPTIFPTLPALELLDLTHWSPRIPDLTALLTPGSTARLPTLQHLILDHGGEIGRSDFHESDEIEEGAPEEVETHSWAALGAHLTAHKDALALRSLCAALHDTRWEGYPVGWRLDRADLREVLGGNALPERLRICTAWPITYEAQEPAPPADEKKESDEDLYAHVEGCGHLAYPPGQQPTTGLWPALGEENRAMATLKGVQWY